MVMNFAGKGTIDWLFAEQLRVDEEWSLRLPTGFRWWADQQAQTVEVVRTETGPAGEVGYVVSIRTDLLRDVSLDEKSLALCHLLLMQAASMAGPVHDEHQRTLSLCSLVRMHQGIAQWMNPLLSVAATLQIGEARTVGPALAKALGATLAASSHPTSGARSRPDEMARLADKVIAPMGQRPSRWRAAEFQATVDEYMQQPPALLASAGGPGFTVEFPFGTSSSLCRVMADQPHPRYGFGLLVLQTFPHSAESAAEGVRLALSLNREELCNGPFGYGFGSYAYKQDMLHFAAFYPNATYRPGLLPNIYFTCAARAHEIAQRQTGQDWTDESFDVKRTALGRLMNRAPGRSR
jgi:hypothetical protein